MIGIVGHMSGGKTYSAVADMLERLLDGHVVVTNIKLRCQGVTDYLGVPCCSWKKNYYYLTETPKGYHEISLLDYENYPMGTPRGESGYYENLVYIYFDEVSSVFDSITHSASKGIQEVATWARHTEKRGQMMYLIMQFSTELHKRLRNHVTEYITCVNSSNIKLPILHIGLPFFLKGYVIQSRFAGDEETPLGSSHWIPIQPKIYDCYYTGQIVFGSQVGRTVEKVTFDFQYRRVRQWLKLLIIVLVLTILNMLLCSLCLRFFSSMF